MSAYHSFTSSRTIEPDEISLLNQLKALDATAGIQHGLGSDKYIVKKATAWTGPQITAVQNIIDTAPAISPQLTAQNQVDNMSVFEKAILLTIIDELNRLRTQPTTTFTAFTPAQAIAAVRAKAGTL